MVSTLKLTMCWQGVPGFLHVEFVCPPAPLVDTSVESIAAALWGHPLLKQLQAGVDELHSLADVSSHTNECDGASGNDRLHWAVTDPEKWDKVLADCLYEVLLCGNHGQHLAQISSIGLVDPELLAEVFTASVFLKADGHFRRLLHAVRAVASTLVFSIRVCHRLV